MSRKSSTSPWVWIGCGCVVMVVVIVAVFAGLGVAGYSLITDMAADMADPLARNEAAMQLLGADQLPEGYQTIGFFKIPWVMEMVFLSDSDRAPMKIEGNFEEKMEAFEDLEMDTRDLGRNSFFYLKLRGGEDAQSLEEMMSRGARRGPSHVDVGAELESLEQLVTGQLTLHGRAIDWRAHRGTLADGSEAVDGLFAVFSFDCASKSHRHDAFWFQRSSEAPEAGTDTSPEMVPEAHEQSGGSLEGTPADPAAIEALLSHFDVCS